MLLGWNPSTAQAQRHHQLIAVPGLAIAELAAAIVAGQDPTPRFLAQELHLGRSSAADLDRLRRAIDFARADDWLAAHEILANAENPLFISFLRWLDYRRGDTEVAFADIQNFLMSHPNWPQINRLRRNAEDALDSDHPEAQGRWVTDYFRRYPPLTSAGRLADFQYRSADIKLMPTREEIRTTWVRTNFESADEANFLTVYGQFLDQTTHIDRLDRLVWERKIGAARRMYSLVTPTDVALAKARLTLSSNSGGTDQAIAAVPEELRQSPALLYERLRWRRRNGLDDGATDILNTFPDALTRPDKWARERQIFARHVLGEGEYEDAYLIAGGHSLDRGTSFAELEFLTGWLALTRLDLADEALARFTSLYHNTSMPISRARGAYWAGRAAVATGESDLANRWFEIAAAYPSVFYGQQALIELDRDFSPIATAPEPNRADHIAFEANSMSRLADALIALGEPGYAATFALAAGRNATTPQQHILAARDAIRLNLPHIAVTIAKQSVRATGDVVESGYPIRALPPEISGNNTPELALVLSIIRQESSFRTDAVSPVGARGLMQLMPGTARETAARSGMTYSRAQLTANGAYNMRLGISLLATLLEKYDESYALAAAAYNAGPHRVDSWLGSIGDPRDERPGENRALIDWIESIPFSETRNYVQRVLETVTVYRHILAANGGAIINVAELGTVVR